MDGHPRNSDLDVSLTMKEAQPRYLDQMAQGLLGTPMDRPEGRLKVTGTAPYAAEHQPDNLATGVLVRATITKGRVAAIDTEAARAMEGVIDVLTGVPMVRNPAQGTAAEVPEQVLPEVHYFGQPIAVVVAETFEQARHAALSLEVTYDVEPGADVDPDTASVVETPDAQRLAQGDIEAAMKASAHSVDVRYTTPPHNSAAMEPHASVAAWKDGKLTLHGSYQMLRYNVAELADTLGVDPADIRIHSPYVGGGFGSKLGIAPEAVAAAHAARELGRPVRVVLSRDQVFEMTMRRTETLQRLRLGCDAEGRLTAIGHEDRVSNLPGEAFSEPTAQGTHFLYGGAARFFEQTVARVHRTCAGSVRAPGEAVGMIALECAMDELAHETGIDPIELRLRNVPDRHPENDLPYSERALKESLRKGAERFGWSDRKAPATRREGDWWIGMGVAAAVRTNVLMQSTARITLRPDGTALCETDMTDIGTGSYAIMTQIAGEMLGLPPEKVEVRLGDSDLPKSSGSGGSWGAQSCGSAVFLAARSLRAAIAERMGVDESGLTLKDGLATGGNVQSPLSELLDAPLTCEGTIEPGDTADHFSIAGYGAHFAEVAVHRDTGDVRMRRMLGVFSIGRVLNEKTASSQCHGGMIWGIGSALTEEILHDPSDGRIVNHNLAEYHVPVSLDVPRLDVLLLEDARDDQANPIQAKGIGELGISGAAAAVGNAVFNACGVRVRDYPITPDKVFPNLPDGD